MHLTRQTPNSRHAIVLLNDEDVTRRTVEAHSAEGWVDLFEIETPAIEGKPIRFRLEVGPDGKKRPVVTRNHGRVSISFAKGQA